MKKLILSVALVALALAGTAQTAQAIPITGKVDYVGSFTTAPSTSFLAPTGTVSITSAVVLDPSNVAGNLATLITPLPAVLVHAPSISYDPIVAPISPLWTHVGSGVSFELTAFSVVVRTANLLTLSGTGVFSGPVGYDDTPGEWVMTLNRATGQVSGTYSASSSVPEPATLSLLGLGLLGAAAAARRRRS